MENKHTKEELLQWQALPLSVKVRMTKHRIRDWVDYFGEDGVYVSFSGGKDSTVLLDLVRQDYPNVEAVFVDVPTQFPELKQFATTFPNVTVLHPKIGYAQVVEKYGFPFFPKEIAGTIYESKKFLSKLEKENLERDEEGNYPKWVYDAGTVRFLQIEGKLPHKEKGVITNEYSKMYDKSKYKFMLDAPFEVSDACCKIMKKKPVHNYHKETGKVPIIATMASESRLRTEQWLSHGCNAWDSKIPASTPMSFWTEQDVLLYIKQNNLPICSVYGDIVENLSGTEQVEGQMTISDLAGFEDMGAFDAERLPLKTTGCDRTGCVLCGFGCHIKNDSRFVDLKETHPNLYGLIDKFSNNGVTMREAIDWINEHGNLNIRY